MADEPKPCPRCRKGKPVNKCNMSPSHWLECDNCGFYLSASVERWNEMSTMASIPKTLAEHACTLSKSGTVVTIQCDNAEGAEELLDWLSELG